LGAYAYVESLEVTWPSGRKQSVTEGIAPNSLLVITEPR
jgi:hypothetical protein